MAKRCPVLAVSALALCLAAAPAAAQKVTPAFAHPLPNVPGKTVTGLLVEYAPGERTARHRHAGSVVAYVMTGAIRSEVSGGGPARVYEAGESFFEPPGSAHLVSENASTTEPASLLAVIIADDGAELTMFDR